MRGSTNLREWLTTEDAVKVAYEATGGEGSPHIRSILAALAEKSPDQPQPTSVDREKLPTFSCSGSEESYIAESREELEKEKARIHLDHGVLHADGSPVKRRLEEINTTLKRLDKSAEECDVPPPGWRCTRPKGHDGPCAAIPVPADREKLEVPQEAVSALVRDLDGKQLTWLASSPPGRKAIARAALETAHPFIYDQAVQDYREKLLAEVGEALKGEAAVHALYTTVPHLTTDNDAGPDEWEGVMLEQALRAAWEAALASIEEAEEDCEPKASDWIPCGGTGLKTWAATGNTVPTFLCPGCPDCDTGKKPEGGDGG